VLLLGACAVLVVGTESLEMTPAWRARSVRSEPLSRGTSRAYGTKFGRPRTVDDPEHIATAKRMKADGHTARDIAKYLGVSRATLYRYLTDARAAGPGHRMSV